MNSNRLYGITDGKSYYHVFLAMNRTKKPFLFIYKFTPWRTAAKHIKSGTTLGSVLMWRGKLRLRTRTLQYVLTPASATTHCT